MADDDDILEVKDLIGELDALMTEQASNNRYLARVHDYLARGVKQLPLFRLGITGGFATGKSTVAQCFEDLGCPIVNADLIVHDLLARDTDTITDVRNLFGDGILDPVRPEPVEGPSGGSIVRQAHDSPRTVVIDRIKLAQRVFANPEERKALEAILHPRVGAIMQREAIRLEQDDLSLACFEIPLLYEAGWEDWCDSVIVVACDEETQITRAMLKLGTTREDAIARIHAQMPLEEKMKRADVVIDNTGPIELLKAEVEAIYNRLLPQS